MASQEITIERLKIGARFSMSTEMLFGTVLEVEDVIGRVVHFQVNGYLASQRLGRYHFEAPADWWQAFRQRWAPAWWLALYPVRMRSEQIDALAVYPGIAMPERTHEIIYSRWPTLEAEP